MQKRIKELAAGKCGGAASVLKISPDRLELEVMEGGAAGGMFSLESMDGTKVAGMVYSSNPRMRCREPRFQGIKVRQEFEFQAEGLSEGDVQDGNFHIICSLGEYDVPFSVSVSKDYADSPMGKVTSVLQFANLAGQSYKEAAKVFGKPEFFHVFGRQEEELRMACRMLARKPCTEAQVEEFLIAAKKKERASFQVEEAEREFSKLRESAKQQITLKKEEAGYLSIEMASDAEWARPVKSRITSDDFVGSSAAAEYVIDVEKLHPGRNYARITFCTMFQTKQVQICVLQKQEEHDRTESKIRKKMVEIGEAYVRFGLRQMVTGAWAKLTVQKLDELHVLRPDNQWYLLAKAQVFLVNRQRQEAEWALKEFPKRQVDKDTPLYAYYRYVCTLFEPEPSYVSRQTGKVKKVYQKYRENNLLMWILLFMDEELNYNPGRKLEAIEKQLGRGGESPALYLEAYRLYAKEPYLMKKPGRFERKILNWAAKRHALTREIAEQFCQLVPQISECGPIWRRILYACYKAYPEKEMLQAICSYLMKWNCYGEAYFKWYDKGVEEELRLAGIYEAWALSAGPEQMKKMPKPIVVYFRYNSSLPYRQMAMVYEAALENQASWKSSFPHYKKAMEEFALRQLRAGRMDRHIARVYQEVLEPEMITEELADPLGKVLFSHEAVCRNPNARYLIVRQYPLAGEQAVPLKDGKGYVNLYSSSYQALIEDAKGNRFLPEEEIRMRPLMDSGKFLERGMQCAKDKLPFLVKYFDGKKIWQTFSKDDLARLQELMRSDAISDEYRAEMRPQMVSYYYHNFTGDALDGFLENVSFEGLQKPEREKIMELLVGRRHYGRIYELLRAYGCDIIPPKKLVYVICSRMEEEELEEQVEPDEFLLELCRNVFCQGKYNERILLYMCRYYHGKLEDMIKLWQAACNFVLDTYALEERCLVQFLYTGDFSVDMEKIFESYGEKHGREDVILAYLSQMSHQYVAKDAVVSDHVFQKILRLLEKGQELNEVCRIGFLKWYALSGAPDGGGEWAERILGGYVQRGIYFPFYHKLPGELAGKYLYYDTQFLEYRTAPGTRVAISYLPERRLDYVECKMRQMYDGIFVKGFRVFYGEKIPYYIKEEQDGEWVITQSGQIQNQEFCDNAQGSRYDLVNDMMVSWKMRDEATLLERLRDYGYKDKVVKERFHIL